MADDQTPKKVVKRVVKRPIAPTTPAAGGPTMRYGRPADSPATKVAARDQPAAAPPSPGGPITTVKSKGKGLPAIKRPSISAPNINVKPALDSIRSRTSSAATAIGSRAGRAGRATSDFTAHRWAAVRAWRIPQLEPTRATVITGLLVGLICVGLGVAALALFTEVRGVANGGPLWGTLTFVIVSIVAFALGERLLGAFGTAAPRVTSFLAVMLTLITILSVFLGLADSRFGLVLVPVLTAAAFWVAHRLLAMAESSPADVE
ncbi:MAG: hypothetical protein WB508_12415 [Aeromicrobium sp.]|uniref:hypothetical protein n=1 Tax=Aeromicrobium sp. TaxID=1871063 RepID=UPI003C4896C3